MLDLDRLRLRDAFLPWISDMKTFPDTGKVEWSRKEHSRGKNIMVIYKSLCTGWTSVYCKKNWMIELEVNGIGLVKIKNKKTLVLEGSFIKHKRSNLCQRGSFTRFICYVAIDLID